jgi:predicted hydrolase (HD superfamily)
LTTLEPGASFLNAELPGKLAAIQKYNENHDQPHTGRLASASFAVDARSRFVTAFRLRRSGLGR